MIRLPRTILVLLLALSVAILSVAQWDRTVFVLLLLQGILALAITTIAVIEIIAAVRSWKKSPAWHKVRLLAVLAISAALMLGTSYLVRTDGGKKLWIKATASEPSGHVVLDLYSDNTFKLLHSGQISGTYYRGGYSFSDDTLQVDNERLRYLYPTLTFVLLEDKTNDATYLVSEYVQDSAVVKRKLLVRAGDIAYPQAP
jgi:hypothetical protein